MSEQRNRQYILAARPRGLPTPTDVPMREVPQRLAELPADATIVVACRSGSRSATVVQFLRRNGLERAVNLEGGILAWSHRIDPSVPRY